MAALTGNAGGQVQNLPNVNLAGARERTFVATIALGSQPAGTTFGIARLPLQSVITGITAITDTSLGTATIALGDANTTNAYMNAQTLTSTNTPTRVGLAAAHGQPIASGYDCVTGKASTVYEDVTLTTAVAALPASGNLCVIIEYALD